MKTKIFKNTENGVMITDIDKALELARDQKYFNKQFDVHIDTLNMIYDRSQDELSTLLNFYLIGKLQGIKQGIDYQKRKELM